jgi:hypothetical protein
MANSTINLTRIGSDSFSLSFANNFVKSAPFQKEEFPLMPFSVDMCSSKDTRIDEYNRNVRAKTGDLTGEQREIAGDRANKILERIRMAKNDSGNENDYEYKFPSPYVKVTDMLEDRKKADRTSEFSNITKNMAKTTSDEISEQSWGDVKKGCNQCFNRVIFNSLSCTQDERVLARLGRSFGDYKDTPISESNAGNAKMSVLKELINQKDEHLNKIIARICTGAADKSVGTTAVNDKNVILGKGLKSIIDNPASPACDLKLAGIAMSFKGEPEYEAIVRKAVLEQIEKKDNNTPSARLLAGVCLKADEDFRALGGTNQFTYGNKLADKVFDLILQDPNATFENRQVAGEGKQVSNPRHNQMAEYQLKLEKMKEIYYTAEDDYRLPEKIPSL